VESVIDRRKQKNRNNERIFHAALADLIKRKGTKLTPDLEREAQEIFSLYHPTLISFDFAIKFLLRDKSCYDIVENFISNLLTAAGYKKIKIVTILDPESNKEHRHAKRSVIDIVVEDTDGNRYLIEIDKYHNNLLFHKSLFNTSRSVVDSIGSGEKYGKIQKVFHISIAYFPLGESALYHGTTEIKALDTNEVLIYNLKKGENEQYNAAAIFPTYFFVSIPSFNDIISSEIDEWLYVLKHQEVLPTFTSPIMPKLEERINYLKMSKTARNEYIRHQIHNASFENSLEVAMERGKAEGIKLGEMKGIAKGRVEGMAKGRAELAQREREIVENMLKAGMTKEQIELITNLKGRKLASLIRGIRKSTFN